MFIVNSVLVGVSLIGRAVVSVWFESDGGGGCDCLLCGY